MAAVFELVPSSRIWIDDGAPCASSRANPVGMISASEARPDCSISPASASLAEWAASLNSSPAKKLRSRLRLSGVRSKSRTVSSKCLISLDSATVQFTTSPVYRNRIRTSTTRFRENWINSFSIRLVRRGLISRHLLSQPRGGDHEDDCRIGNQHQDVRPQLTEPGAL